MFLESSRYYKEKTAHVQTKDGRVVTVVTLRRLSSPGSKTTVTKGNDRLDILSQRLYKNPTMFWYIADANTELEANRLVEKTGRTIRIPE